MRPVIRGLCSYESLIENRIHIEDLARMNDALDVLEENQRRVAEAEE